MNTLCLDNYGVSKMETQEMKDTDGGWLHVVRAVKAIVVAAAAIHEMTCDGSPHTMRWRSYGGAGWR